MGSNVFGTPITTAMLRALPEYHEKKTITQTERARVALEMKNAEGKDINAKKFVENIKDAFTLVCTMSLIYNATGETMTFVEARDWEGRVLETHYPVIIANGQWGAFVHGQNFGGPQASRAGLVYTAINSQGQARDWFMGFHNSSSIPSNRVLFLYCSCFSFLNKFDSLTPRLRITQTLFIQVLDHQPN